MAPRRVTREQFNQMVANGAEFQVVGQESSSGSLAEQIAAALGAVGNATGDVLSSGLDGATFGFGDEILAGVTSPMRAIVQGQGLGKSYDEQLGLIREDMQQYKDKNPVISAGTEIAGAVAPTKYIGAATKMIPGLAKALTGSLPARIIAGAGTGAAGAAASGFGRGEGGLEERIAEALSAAPAGAVMGGAASALPPQIIDDVGYASKRRALGFPRAASTKSARGHGRKQLIKTGRTKFDSAIDDLDDAGWFEGIVGDAESYRRKAVAESEAIGDQISDLVEGISQKAEREGIRPLYSLKNVEEFIDARPAGIEESLRKVARGELSAARDKGLLDTISGLNKEKMKVYKGAYDTSTDEVLKALGRDLKQGVETSVELVEPGAAQQLRGLNKQYGDRQEVLNGILKSLAAPDTDIGVIANRMARTSTGDSLKFAGPALSGVLGMGLNYMSTPGMRREAGVWLQELAELLARGGAQTVGGAIGTTVQDRIK